MRKLLIAGSTCLLTAASAFGQTPTNLSLPPASLGPVSAFDPAPPTTPEVAPAPTVRVGPVSTFDPVPAPAPTSAPAARVGPVSTFDPVAPRLPSSTPATSVGPVSAFDPTPAAPAGPVAPPVASIGSVSSFAPAPATSYNGVSAFPLNGCPSCTTVAAPSGGPLPRVWGSAEYLLWWVTPMNTPPLITTVPTAFAVPGQQIPAGVSSTYFPFTRQLDFGVFSGGRATVGYSFNRFGLDVSGFVLEQKSSSGGLFNTGVPAAVAQGYISAGSGIDTNLFSSLSGQYVGGTSASVNSRLWGLEGNVRFPCYALFSDVTDGLVGFRYLDLEENLFVASRSVFPDGGEALNQDTVQTRNQFYGGQIGLDARLGGFERGFGLNVLPKIALGGVKQQVALNGSNTFLTPGLPPDIEAGGLYARGSNFGVFSRDKFAAVFELNTNLTYNFTSWAQVYVGYSIIWISSVQRPGEAIDPVINDSQVRFVAGGTPSDANRPVFQWRANDFWTQGITFGVRLQY